MTEKNTSNVYEGRYATRTSHFRCLKVELLTIRKKHPPGTDKETKRNHPLHENPSKIVLVREMGVVGDRVFGLPKKSYTEDLAIMDMSVFLAVRRDNSPLPGDTILCDYPVETLKPGTLIGIGDAIVEVSSKPHTACDRFAARFGKDAARWVNRNKDRNLRGVKAFVVRSGTVRIGQQLRLNP
jgi:hypothetical protein